MSLLTGQDQYDRQPGYSRMYDNGFDSGYAGDAEPYEEHVHPDYFIGYRDGRDAMETMEELTDIRHDDDEEN